MCSVGPKKYQYHLEAMLSEASGATCRHASLNLARPGLLSADCLASEMGTEGRAPAASARGTCEVYDTKSEATRPKAAKNQEN